MTDTFPNRTWAEVDLDILAENIREIRRITSPDAEVMGVVKADAYGHGAVRTARVLLENGASRLAVSMLDEAIELRHAGIKAPILILSQIDRRRIPELLEYDITETVFSAEFAESISEEALRTGKTARIHIKLDTGMGRVGFPAVPDSVPEILKIAGMPGLFPEGIFTHFATSDEPDNEYCERQFEKFMTTVGELQARGLRFPIRHVCNSAALMRFPNMHLDMVRAGLILYGMWPKGCPEAYQPITLKPVMTLKTTVIHVKELPEGEAVSYGRHFTAPRKSVIATIPVGYADGYSRRLSNRADVLFRGQRARVIGSICMDMCMIDVTDFEKRPGIGDEIILFGTETAENRKYSLSVDEISDLLDTINYEITCLVGKRVPRVFLKSGSIVYIDSCLR